jgi:hypothetical protein
MMLAFAKRKTKIATDVKPGASRNGLGRVE